MRMAIRVLKLFCPPELREEIAGDLAERYQRNLHSKGRVRAIVRLYAAAFLFLRPGIIFRNRFRLKSTSPFMLIHFIKVFVRATLKDKLYSLLNISGLVVSLVVAMFMFLWIVDEVSYDHFHEGNDRIYRVMSNHTFTEGIETMDDTPGPLSPALASLPEVDHTCRVIRFGVRPVFTIRNEEYFAEGMYADPSVLQVFTIPIVAGDLKTPLSGTNDIMVSERFAAKYFPEGNAVGSAVRMDNETDLRITAVFQDMPGPSTLKFEFILPFARYADGDPYVDEWGAWSGGETFVKLHRKEDQLTVEEKMDQHFTRPHIWVRWDTNVSLFLFPLKDWRLFSDFRDGQQAGGRITYVAWLGVAAVFILLVACANFMNMATARALVRAREIGVRKVLGAVRSSLIRQFMTEAMVTACLAMCTALIVVHLLLPSFNTLAGKRLVVDYFNSWTTGGVIAITLFTGLVAGIYPAFFLSAAGPANALKNLANTGGSLIRRGLVVFQFTMSTCLIVFALVVHQQISYMKTVNLGFDRQGIFFLPYGKATSDNFEAFQQQALTSGVITDMTRSSGNPMRVFGGMVLSDNAWPGKTSEDEVVFQVIATDARFLDFMKINVLAGRNFSADLPGDSSNYLITKEAARRMQLKDPVGAQLVAPTRGEIVGLVSDFYTRELREQLQPVIIRMKTPETGLLFVRYKEGKLEEALATIDNLHRAFEPGSPSQIQFMDDTFNQLYAEEVLLAKLARIFTAIAIFVSCLGLFGLVSYSAQRRRKEIGIRKVLGATVSSLVTLLCRDFLGLIVLSMVCGLPIAWFGAQFFLERYVQHTAPGASVVVLAAVSLLAAALVAVIFQSLKAAMADPANVLRSE